MALNDEQRSIVESSLRLNDLGEIDGPNITLKLNKRETRLVIEALDHFRETNCPIEGKGEECALIFWSENVHTGALEKNCIGSCDRLIDVLLGAKTQQAFDLRR